MNTTSLKECFDNSTKHSDKWEPYFDVYEKHLSHLPLQSVPQTLVEVGVQRGGSLEMWSSYIGPLHKIIGIDVDPECAKLEYDNKNIEVVIGDQGEPIFWDGFFSKHPSIDVFIDDGGHFMHQQILTFEKVFPHLRTGGVYICEDCHTSYMPYNGGGLNTKGSFIEYAKSYIDVIHSKWYQDFDTELDRRKKISKDLTSIHFYDSIVVFEKQGAKEMKRVFPKQF